MPRLLLFLRVLTGIVTVLMIVLICWQCIDIYLDGNAPENIGANGVHLTSVFRMDDVVDRFKALATPLIACTLMIAATAVLHSIAGERSTDASAGVSSGRHHHLTKTCPPELPCEAAAEGSSGHFVRISLIVLAVVFVLLGVMNGGLYDVWVKAINICTECIGLG